MATPAVVNDRELSLSHDNPIELLNENWSAPRKMFRRLINTRMAAVEMNIVPRGTISRAI